MSTEVNKLKISMDRSQLSDLVLLERLQKAEVLVRESLNWTKEAAEIWRQVKEVPATKAEPTAVGSEASVGPLQGDAEGARVSRPAPWRSPSGPRRPRCNPPRQPRRRTRVRARSARRARLRIG